MLWQCLRVQFRKTLYPHGVFVAKYNRQPVPDGILMSVVSFVVLFVVTVAVIALLLAFLGLDVLTALSGALTAVANVGPGLGSVIGPAGSFADLPDAAKWLLSAGMIMGRLELVPVLMVASPLYWRT